MNIIEMIEKHNLSIRRIPNKITNCYEMRHFKKGDKAITYDNGVKRTTRITIPKHAGMYMVKEVLDTSSTIRWNSKTDNVANTLEESIKLFLEKQKI